MGRLRESNLHIALALGKGLRRKSLEGRDHLFKSRKKKKKKKRPKKKKSSQKCTAIIYLKGRLAQTPMTGLKDQSAVVCRDIISGGDGKEAF